MRDFEEIYRDYAEGLMGYVLYRTGDRTLAEDVVADTFERALRARGRFQRRRGSEKTWIYSIALNLLRDHARHQAVVSRTITSGRLTAPSADDDPFDQVAARDLVGRALDLLSPEEREVIALRYGAALTLAEVAAVIGEQASTTEGRIYRGLRKMRSELES